MKKKVKEMRRKFEQKSPVPIREASPVAIEDQQSTLISQNTISESDVTAARLEYDTDKDVTVDVIGDSTDFSAFFRVEAVEIHQPAERLLEPIKYDHPEKPERIKCIIDKLTTDGLVDRCTRLESRAATIDEMLLIHKEKYLKDLAKSKTKIDDIMSVYFCSDTWKAASLACGNLLECVDAVMNGRALNGVAVIRPPGHHAKPDTAYGFCYVNNVAVAAMYARKAGVGKILIVDWDVHHGNGIQEAFWNDRSVLYVSLHRYGNGKFFPTNERNHYKDIGEGAGRGFNINIPWSRKGVGDPEYLEAFKKIIVPVASDFKSNLVLVAAGLDAAEGDPIGECKVSPFGFAQMTASLCELIGGRVILALEGGYNLDSMRDSMAACVQVLLGEAPANPKNVVKPCSDGARKTIQNVSEELKYFWPCLENGGRLHAGKTVPSSTPNSSSFCVDNSSTPEAALETPLTISVLLDRTEFCDYAHGLEVEADSDSLPSVTLDTLSTKKEDPRKNPARQNGTTENVQLCQRGPDALATNRNTSPDKITRWCRPKKRASAPPLREMCV